MAKWTANDIPDQSGRVVIVTGANTGIGYEAARVLANKGAEVVVACRNMQKGQAAVEKIIAQNNRAKVNLMQLNLSNLDSVRTFADEFRSQYDRLDVLINNAGVMMLPKRELTADGFEMQIGTNHFGHFALTGLLIDRVMATPDSRIVTVSSSAHHFGRIKFDDINFEGAYNPQTAYGQSKIANLYFAYELQRKLKAAGSHVISTTCHPGWTATDLQRHAGFFRFLNPFFAQGPEMGALPTLYAAIAPDIKGAEYVGPDGFMGMRGHPQISESNKRSQDREIATKLWDVSEQLTDVKYEFRQSIVV